MLLFIVVLPFAVYVAVAEPQAPPRIEHLKPTWPSDWSMVKWGAFGSAMVGVIWAYHGWMNIGMMAPPTMAIGIGLIGFSTHSRIAKILLTAGFVSTFCIVRLQGTLMG